MRVYPLGLSPKTHRRKRLLHDNVRYVSVARLVTQGSDTVQRLESTTQNAGMPASRHDVLLLYRLVGVFELEMIRLE
jgi:hypothetical protein